jgi:predicted enzyme related to lactoylglutathione lyase
LDGTPAFTAWEPFPADTDYFDPSDKPFMINFRVRQLDDLLERLRTAGVEVDARLDEYDYGRFGWAMDPDGQRIELWEPPDPEGTSDP